MQLIRLEREHVALFKNKKIYFITWFQNYVEEIYSIYPDFPVVSGGIDLKERNQGFKEFHGVKVPIYGYDFLNNLPENSILIITNGYFKENYDEILSHGVSENAGNVIYYYANKDTKYYMEYNDKYLDEKLKDIIVFRSGPAVSSYVYGMDYADNARALFEYMLLIKLNQKYKLVWFVKNPNDFKAIEDNNENVSFISYDGAVSDDKNERDEYYEALCLAKYIFMTDAYGFCRYARNDQIRVQLWHGCGFKTRTVFSRCEHRYEYNIVISDLYKKIHKEIYGLRDDQVLITGYPKEDWLYHPYTKWKEAFNIPDAQKYIFWLPTFRASVGQLSELNETVPEGETGFPILYSEDDFGKLNSILSRGNTEMVIKLHPFQNREALSLGSYSNIILLDNDMIFDAGIQINELLGHADALISDYSSVAVDYLQLDRPIGFTLDDVEEYEKNRGFVFDNIREWLPGVEIFSNEDFFSFVDEIIHRGDSSKEKRHIIASLMHDFRDDQSSRRVLEALDIY